MYTVGFFYVSGIVFWAFILWKAGALIGYIITASVIKAVEVYRYCRRFRVNGEFKYSRLRCLKAATKRFFSAMWSG
ncbi:hypothetical protein SAMN05421647_103463 [Marinobacterium stanieri]|uniref:Uncharacterized protein n=1 Tax=Marinobacterium stanieri TaxID=49186 RepID=A0A1N6RQB8_9GAMM|nr:hypothetical protein SAMN05421647_103463 [Marinobacterium stanieri]